MKVVLTHAHDVDKILREEESYIKALVVALKKLGTQTRRHGLRLKMLYRC